MQGSEVAMTSLTKAHSTARLARRFLADQLGATAIEYAMIAAGVGATVASTVWGLGSQLKAGWYDKLASMF
jgi:Flp pilus assembly pilin Flp